MGAYAPSIEQDIAVRQRVHTRFRNITARGGMVKHLIPVSDLICLVFVQMVHF